jgi:hypothetical protein
MDRPSALHPAINPRLRDCVAPIQLFAFPVLAMPGCADGKEAKTRGLRATAFSRSGELWREERLGCLACGSRLSTLL